MKRQPVPGVDFDPDGDMCQDDYEWFTSTGQYEGDGWAEWQEALEERRQLLKRIDAILGRKQHELG